MLFFATVVSYLGELLVHKISNSNQYHVNENLYQIELGTRLVYVLGNLLDKALGIHH